MSDATVDMSLQESCLDAARHLSVEVRLLSSKADELEAENAKQRELIQRIWRWERNGCYECPLEKDCKVLCVYDGDCGMAVEIEKELQELGIEVE